MEDRTKHIVMLAGIAILCLLVLKLMLIPASAHEITIVADEWAPYCGRSGSESPGYGIEIAEQVFKSVGHPIRYQNIPWIRAIEDTREGKFNAIIGALKEEAPDFVFPDEEFGVLRYVFITNAESTWQYRGIPSLVGASIGIIKGYSYGSELDDHFKRNPWNVEYVQGVDPLYQNIKKLLAGRVDALIAGEQVVLYKAREMKVEGQIINAGTTDIGGKLYIAFSPALEDSALYAKIFSEGIRKLHQSGRLAPILAKYQIPYWK